MLSTRAGEPVISNRHRNYSPLFTHLAGISANLSGGQRLALARALYLDAPILLLDELSSALDSKSEDTLAHLLRHLRDEHDRTILVAAHTPKLTEIADLLVTMTGARSSP